MSQSELESQLKAFAAAGETPLSGSSARRHWLFYAKPLMLASLVRRESSVDAELAKVGPEYYVSFDLDGTPRGFNEGLLDFENVPFAFVETGREKNGHVYDRAHIFAVPVGLSLEGEFPDDSYLDIVLVGEPGNQPPLSRHVHVLRRVQRSLPRRIRLAGL